MISYPQLFTFIKPIELILNFFYSIVFCSLVLISFDATGQKPEIIQSGRPGQSIGAGTVGKHVFQLQTGNTLLQTKFFGLKRNQITNTTVGRFGITDRFEASLLIAGGLSKTKGPEVEYKTDGIYALQLGGRIDLIQEAGLIPSVAFQSRFSIKRILDDLPLKNQGINSILSISKSITKSFSVTLNGRASNGYEFNSFNFSYVANASLQITNKLSAMAELYTNNYKNDPFWDAGIAYLLNKNSLLDISFGQENSQFYKTSFVDLGISMRF